MVTGASVSDAVIVLVDGRVGPTEQTWRHLFISSLLGVRHVVLAVNKLDLIDHDPVPYRAVVDRVLQHVDQLPFPVEVTPIPISALNGDNVVDLGDSTPWYDGASLLGHLEEIEIVTDAFVGARLPVQWIVRPHGQEFHDHRGLAGRLTGGPLEIGDEVLILPSGARSSVAAIDRGGDPVDRAVPSESISIQLVDDIDVGRGDMVVAASADRIPDVTFAFEADICWMTERPLVPGSRWALKHTTRSTRAIVTEIIARYDVETAGSGPVDSFVLNDLGRIRVATLSPLAVDPYEVQRHCGSAILIDESSGATVGALMIRTTTE
ncbi:MAG: elongation factor 1-alpha C-terminal domain-related protein, partial [Actinomycetota bacterium]